jgi:hypothetical protein
MATIPYQPTYTTTPKYGLRYGPSQFAPTTGTLGQGSASQQIPPATLGTQQGGYTMADPFSGNQQFAQQEAAYAQAQPSGVNNEAYYGQPIQGIATQPIVGFRRLAPGMTQPPPPSYTPAPTPPITTEPPVQPTSSSMVDPFSNSDDDDDSFNQALIDQRNAFSSTFNYTRGTSNPIGVLGMIPGVGFAMNALGYDPNEGGYTYGTGGTTDSQGNMFGNNGQAFDPLTGKAVASFGGPVTMSDISKSSLAHLGVPGFDQSDMIEPYRATNDMIRQGVTDASLAGVPSIPGEVSIQAAIDPDAPMTNLGTNESFNEAATAGTVTDSRGNPVTTTARDGTKTVVTTGTAIQQAAAKQAYAAGTTKAPAGSPAAIQSVLDSLDPSKGMTSEETTSISDIISGTGMTLASSREEGDDSNNNSPNSSSNNFSSSPANPANYNNKDGLPGGNTSGGNDSSSPGGACCFIMLEARYGNGAMDKVVRKYRDDHMTQKNRRGYYKVAEVLVPLMRKSKVFKWIITKTFADPLVSYGKWYYGENKHGWIFAPIKSMWLKLFDIVGTDTVFIRENGEEV